MKWILIAELFSYVYRHKLVSTARKRKGLKKEGLVYVHLTNVLSSSHCYTFQHRYRSISARILLLPAYLLVLLQVESECPQQSFTSCAGDRHNMPPPLTS